MGFGEQVINITSWDQLVVIVHELGHCLGLLHEHQRHDRDPFILVNDDNMQSGFEGQLDLMPFSNVQGPYDFDSVVHYDRCAFSMCCPGGATCNCAPNCQTITVLPPNQAFQNTIGQRDHLSYLDGTIMSLLYPEDDTVFFALGGGPGNGSLSSPHNEFQLSLVPAEGTAVLLNGGTYINESGITIDQAMTIKAPLGGALFGE